MKHFVISIDGGGVGAVIPARILERLQAFRPGLFNAVSVVGGTSAGGIVAGAIASGLPMSRVVDLFQRHSRRIFKRRFWRTLVTVFGWFGAKYSPDFLNSILRDVFGGVRLGELTKKIVLPAVQLDMPTIDSGVHWDAREFTNYPNDRQLLDVLLTDAIMATTAAPTIFPTHRIASVGNFADGGLYAANPLAVTVSRIREHDANPEIVVLSLGCGVAVRSMPIGNLGKYTWARRGLSLLLDVPSRAAVRHINVWPCVRMFRINPIIPADYALDNAAAVPALYDVANWLDLSSVLDWLTIHWKD